MATFVPLCIFRPRSAVAGLAAIVCAILSVNRLPAATLVWTGGNGGNANAWNTKGNWNPSSGNSGPTTADALQFQASGTLAGNFSPNAAGGSGGSITFLSGATTAFNITGTGTLTLGSATASGITNSSATEHQFSVSTIALGISQTWDVASTGNLTFSSGVALGSNTLTLQGSNTGVGLISGVISGTGAVAKQGSGLWTLSNAGNSYSGVTTISGGTLAVGALANGGSNSGIGASTNAASNLIIDGGTLRYTGSAASTDRLFTIGTNGATLDASGSGALTLNNTGSVALAGTNTARTLTLAGTNTGSNTLAAVVGDNGSGATSLAKAGAGTWVLAATNTYTGGTTVSAGTLNVTGALSSSGAVAVSGGTLSLSNDQQVSSLSGSGGTISFAGRTLTIAQAGNTSYSGALTGSAGNLAKSGGGTLTLSGGNGYTGSTTISAGTLRFSAPTALPSSTPVTLSGGTLEIGATGSYQTTGLLTVSSLSTINFATGVSNATLQFGDSSGATWTGSGAVYLSITNYTAGNTIRFGSDDTALTADQLQHISIDGFRAQWAAGNQGIIEMSTTAIPEPETFALAAGIAALGAVLIRRHRAQRLRGMF